MSRRDGDGGEPTEPSNEDMSIEDEFRQWAEAAEAEDEGSETVGGWAKRIWGRRGKTDEPVSGPSADLNQDDAAIGPSPSDLENPRPDDLGVFRAIKPGEGPPPELRSVSDTAQPHEPAPAGEAVPSVEGPALSDEPVPAEEPVSSEESAAEPQHLPETDRDAFPSEPAQLELAPSESVPSEPASSEPASSEPAGSPGFAELWSQTDASVEPVVPDDSDAEDDDVIDFADFTSEDYLAATTREYAGLAEAVARAEEEGTQRMAVSAEIPGLESGVVGLDDVVSAESGTGSDDMIEPPAGSELSVRVLTGFGLLVLFAASLLSPYGIGALILVVLGIAAGELFAAFIRGGYRPLSIFGFLGIAGAFVGTWIAGPVAVPVALLITAVAVFLFYATVPGRKAAVENATLTVLVTAWIGGLGAFAFDLLGADDYVWLVLGLVITVAAMDVSQYFIGKRMGRRPLAPVVSPKKTVEGYVAGVIVAIAVGAAFAWAPPFDMIDGLLIGVLVAIVAPIGDLAVSVIKRALGVKDMGYILPGHGGVLDRVDAMIVTIPALWIAYSWMGLLT